MTTRLMSRVSAVEEKVAGSGPKNAIRLYFVERYPTDGAEDLLRANGRDLSVPHRIVAFIPTADSAPVASPLIDLTDGFPMSEIARAVEILRRGGIVAFPPRRFMDWAPTRRIRAPCSGCSNSKGAHRPIH